MAKRVKIPGRLESAETGNIVTGADAVMDDAKGKTQVVINSEVDAAIISLAQEKQDNLTFDSAPTEYSPNPVTSAGVYTADKVLSDAIEAILLLIPSAASALNKLVDMQTMNSSIATATASFKGTYNLVSDLHLGVDATHEQIGAALDALSLGADNNDYAFVQVPNSATAPTEISKTERYKFNGENWLYEYDLNNSGFTSPQWNAINSGVTSLLVSKLSNLPTNAELTSLLAGKQDNLTFDNVPTAGSPNPVKSGGVYARNNEIVALINALDAAKQDVLTFDNAPVEGSPNPVKSGGVYTAISAVQAAIVALDAAKQNVLTFDSTPTLGSPNPVTSSGIKTELNRIDGNITTLNDLYEALTQSALVIVQPSDTWPVASPATKTIYRVVDRVNTPPQYYSDYMWNGSVMVLMATYDNVIDEIPTINSDNLVKSGGVYGEYMNCIHFTESVVLPLSFFKQKKVLVMLKEPNLSYSYMARWSQTIQVLVPNVWYLLDLTSYDGSGLQFAYNGSVAADFYFISNQEEVDRIVSESRTWNLVTKSSSAATPGEYYINQDTGTVYLRLSTGDQQGEVFPTLNSYHAMQNIVRPATSDVFIIDGTLSKWDGTKFISYSTYNEGDVEDISKGTISNELKVTQIDFSNWGYLGNSGEVHEGTSENNYQYSDLIPVEKGMMIVYRGGNMAAYSGAVWGYSDINGSNPVKLITGGVYPLQETKYLIASDSVKYIRANSYADREHFVRTYPVLKTRGLYDIVVAQDGSGDYTSLYDAISSVKPIENSAGISPHYSIFVKGGMYEMPQQGGGELAWYRNLSIIGESKESVIIYSNNGVYSDWNTDASCLRLAGKVTLKNLTIISNTGDHTGDSYCVHVDFSAANGDVMEIDNCRMYNDHNCCIGIGLKAGFTLKIRNCEIISDYPTEKNHGAIYCHDGNTESNLPQKIEFVNNIIESSTDNAVVLQSVYGKEIKALFIGNAMFSISTPVVRTINSVTIDQKSCLNNVELI